MDYNPATNHLTTAMAHLSMAEKTRRRMARERRGAESSSAVSMATLYYKTIY